MKKFIGAMAVSAVAALALAGCGSSSTSSSTSACPSGHLRFAIEPYDDAQKLIPAYQALSKALGDKLGCTVDLTVSQSYTAEILAMKNGNLDMGEFGPAGFVFASREAGAVPVASFADKDGKLSTYTAGIWVPQGSPITDIKGLDGKQVALSSTGSTSGDWLPRFAFKQANVNPKIEYAGGHSQSLLALTSGHVDAAEVNSQKEATAIAANPPAFDPSKYTEIWKSDPIANDPVTVSPKLSQTAQDKIKAALLALSPDTVKDIAGFLDFTPGNQAMVAVTKDTYKPLFDLADALGLAEKDL